MMVFKTKGPQIRCINVNLAAKEHAGWNKSLEREKLILKNKTPSNALHSSREVRSGLM